VLSWKRVTRDKQLHLSHHDASMPHLESETATPVFAKPARSRSLMSRISSRWSKS